MRESCQRSMSSPMYACMHGCRRWRTIWSHDTGRGWSADWRPCSLFWSRHGIRVALMAMRRTSAGRKSRRHSHSQPKIVMAATRKYLSSSLECGRTPQDRAATARPRIHAGHGHWVGVHGTRVETNRPDTGPGWTKDTDQGWSSHGTRVVARRTLGGIALKNQVSSLVTLGTPPISGKLPGSPPSVRS